MADTFDPNWRIADDLGVFLAEWLVRNEPETIVEFGSGASTVQFAAYAAHTGASVTSYEQNFDYLHKTRQALAAEALYASIHYAPVRNGWYHRDMVIATIPDNIDLALIDGPGPCPGRTREPAMEYLYPRMSEGGLIVLDDGRREMEQLYVKHWVEQYDGLDVEYVDNAHGAYLIRKVNDG